MSEANGTADRLSPLFEEKRRRGALIRRLMQAEGAGVTFLRLCELLESEREKPTDQGTYYRVRGELWPHLRRKQRPREVVKAELALPPEQRAVDYAPPDPPAAVPDRPAPQPSPTPSAPGAGNDYLTRFVRFAVAVEQAGGTANARRMLDALDQLAAGGTR